MFDVAAAIRAEDGRALFAEAEIQSEKTNQITLESSFSSGESSYKFKLSSDGTGEIFYSDFGGDAEEFAHEVKVEKLVAEIEEAIREQIALQSQENALEDAEIESIREEIFSEVLEEVFWEEINQTLEDPFFRSFYDDGE